MNESDSQEQINGMHTVLDACTHLRRHCRLSYVFSLISEFEGEENSAGASLACFLMANEGRLHCFPAFPHPPYAFRVVS